MKIRLLATSLVIGLIACNIAPSSQLQAAPVSQKATAVPAQTHDIRTEVIEYKQGNQVLQGFLAYDANLKGRRPGVLVIHEWNGLGEYVEGRAKQLAELGYVAFAADIYGKGVRPTPPKAAGQEAGKYYADRDLAKARARAGFDILARHERVNADKIAAMGYCFGGTMTLELARSGAPAVGFVVFHGGLKPTKDEGKNITGEVLVLNGADDPYVPKADIEQFKAEMDSASVKWDMVLYPGAVHAYSNPRTGNNVASGAAYNEAADKASWEAMKAFFTRIFA